MNVGEVRKKRGRGEEKGGGESDTQERRKEEEGGTEQQQEKEEEEGLRLARAGVLSSERERLLGDK